MKSFFIFIIVIASIFVGCESNTKKAKVIESSSVDSSIKSVKSRVYHLKTTEGKNISLELSNGVLLSKDLNGKSVLLNFWATWCPPCKKEMPVFAKLQERYKDKFVIVGVLMEKDKNRDELKAFMKEYGVNFPITVDEDNFLLAKDIGNVQKFPESFLFSKDGLFVKKFIGEVNKQELENYIKDMGEM